MKTSQRLWIFVALCLFASLWSPIDSLRTKRNVINRIIKKKGIAAAATAFVAAASMTKKKFLPIPIVFPLSIMKPPIVETVPVPPPFVGKFGSIHNMMGHSPMMGYHGGGIGIGGGQGFGIGR